MQIRNYYGRYTELENGEYDFDGGDCHIADGEPCEELQDIAEIEAEVVPIGGVEPPAELMANVLRGVAGEIYRGGGSVENDIDDSHSLFLSGLLLSPVRYHRKQYSRIRFWDS